MGGSIQDIVVAVATPGTAVQVSASAQHIGLFAIQARRATGDNVGNVYVGVSTVDRATRQTLVLLPGDFLEPQFEGGNGIDLSDLWIDADNAGDGISGLVVGV